MALGVCQTFSALPALPYTHPPVGPVPKGVPRKADCARGQVEGPALAVPAVVGLGAQAGRDLKAPWAAGAFRQRRRKMCPHNFAFRVGIIFIFSVLLIGYVFFLL